MVERLRKLMTRRKLVSSAGAGAGTLIVPAALMAATTPTPADLVVALDEEWAIFLEDRPGGRGNWTMDQRWRADNPGEYAKLKAYRDGTSTRPFLNTEPGRRMVAHVTAWLAARTLSAPQPEVDPVPPEIPEVLENYQTVVSVTGALEQIEGHWLAHDTFVTYKA